MTIFEKPVFAVPDGLLAEQELKAKYTELTGKELFPAQPESLLTNWAAYLKTVTDTVIQFTGEQCLVNFANGVNLDRLGDFWDAPRLAPQKAITTLRFTLTEVKGADYIVPMGTGVRTVDRLFVFETTANLIIPEGELSGTVTAECTVTGEEANNYGVGQISSLFNLLSDIASVSNTTVSNSGSGIEPDDRYRERLKIAPNKISTAGSKDSYKFLVLSVDPSISSVAVTSPSEMERSQRREDIALELSDLVIERIEENGDIGLVTREDLAMIFSPYIRIPRYSVDIYVLTKNGVPSADLLDKIEGFLSGDNVRPLTDTVRVLPAVAVSQNIRVEVIADINADLTDLSNRLDLAVAKYRNFLSFNLGRDIVVSQLISNLQIEGVYNVSVLEPVANVIIGFNEYVSIGSFDVEITGVSEL